MPVKTSKPAAAAVEDKEATDPAVTIITKPATPELEIVAPEEPEPREPDAGDIYFVNLDGKSGAPKDYVRMVLLRNFVPENAVPLPLGPDDDPNTKKFRKVKKNQVVDVPRSQAAALKRKGVADVILEEFE